MLQFLELTVNLLNTKHLKQLKPHISKAPVFLLPSNIKYLHLQSSTRNITTVFFLKFCSYDFLGITAFYDDTVVFALHYDTILIKGDVMDRKDIGYMSVFLEECCFI